MKLVTGNRLSDGRVIYLGADGAATPVLTEAAVFDDDLADAAVGAAAARPEVFVSPYAIAVIGHRPSGRDRLKETIRSAGPTVGHSLDAR